MGWSCQVWCGAHIESFLGIFIPSIYILCFKYLIQFYESQSFFFPFLRLIKHWLFKWWPQFHTALAAMNRRKTTSRGTSAAMKISHQPPRLLIVNIAVPSWVDICPNLCEALQNFFSIACSLMGPSRMSLFSLYTVQNQHECVLPFVVSLSLLLVSWKQMRFP